MFKKLRGKFAALGMDQNYIARKIGLDRSSVSLRMTGRREWTLSEIYAVMDLINEPYERLNEYFPKGGRDVPTTQKAQSPIPRIEEGGGSIEITLRISVESNGRVILKT